MPDHNLIRTVYLSGDFLFYNLTEGRPGNLKIKRKIYKIFSFEVKEWRNVSNELNLVYITHKRNTPKFVF